jgi:RNA polymerase sigma-70 factor (ECF subfamily)
MINTAINYYRKNMAGSAEDADLPVTANLNANGESVFSYLSTQELLKYIQDLPDGYRIVFNLYAIEGFKHHEIGEMLGISENTSKTQLSKARKALQERIIAEKYETVYRSDTV